MKITNHTHWIVVGVIAVCVLSEPGLRTTQAQQMSEARVRAELAAARKLSPTLVTHLEPVIEQVWRGFSEAEAMATVEFASKYWRLSGNEGYDATLDRVASRVGSSRFEVAAAPSA